MRKDKANPYQRNNFGRTPYEMRDGLFLRKSIYEDLLQSLAGSCDSTSDCHFGGIQATHCRAIDLVACAQRRVLCKHSKEKRSSIQFVRSSLEVSTSPCTTVLQILQGVSRCFKATIVQNAQYSPVRKLIVPSGRGQHVAPHHTDRQGLFGGMLADKILLQFPMNSKAVFHCTLAMIHSAALDQSLELLDDWIV